MIALSNDRMGIELAFWEDQIWAQTSSPLFTHGEGVLVDTTAAEIEYRLTIFNDTHVLSNGAKSILTGALRDYSAFGGVPYTLGSYLFVGDNTSLAGTDATMGSVKLNTFVPAPIMGLTWRMLIAVLGRRRSGSISFENLCDVSKNKLDKY